MCHEQVGHVDYEDRMVQFLSPLSVYIQARSRQQACNCKQIKSRYPNFEEFMDVQAEELSDLVFGKIKHPSKVRRQDVTKPNTQL